MSYWLVVWGNNGEKIHLLKCSSIINECAGILRSSKRGYSVFINQNWGPTTNVSPKTFKEVNL